MPRRTLGVVRRGTAAVLCLLGIANSLACARRPASISAVERRDCANELPTMRLDSSATPDIRLQAMSHGGLYVRVRTPRGEPIGQAKVYFVSVTGVAVRDSTDSNGVVELRLPPEAGEIAMRKVGYYRGLLRLIPRTEYVDTLHVQARCAVPVYTPVLTGRGR